MLKQFQPIHSLLITLFAAYFSICNLSPAVAEPKVCIGYNPDTNYWGSQLRNQQLLCPNHFAFLGAAKPVGESDPETAVISAVCCPLPAEDILSDVEQFVRIQCPENFVATGVRVVSTDQAKTSPSYEFRCTAINSSKYQLGEMTNGALWGFDLSSGPYFWKENRVLKFSDLPAAIRTGLSRHDFQEFSVNGCVGVPYGSLLVGKSGKRCMNFIFRELQYRIKISGFEPGEPVKMFPNCRYITDPFSPQAKCVE